MTANGTDPTRTHGEAAFVCLVECECGRMFASDISEGDARTQMYEHQQSEEAKRDA